MSMLTSDNFALAFDGVNDIVRANQVVGTGPLTIEAWIRPTTANACGLVIVGADDNTGWSLELNDGRLTLWLATNQGWEFNQHATQLQAGQWYHVAATYANGSARTFVNGVASTPTNVGVLTQGPFLRLGGLSDSFGYFFAGVLDEVRISNNIRYMANFTPPAAPFTPDANTLGLWHLNEGAGQIAADSSPSANHGTLGNSSGTDSADPTWVTGYPFAGTPTPTATRTATATSTPTNTPTPTPTPTATVDGFTLIDQDLASGIITIDQAALYRIYALFKSPLLPFQYQSNVLIPDEGTGAFLYAVKDWNQWSPQTQQTIADFVTPKRTTAYLPPNNVKWAALYSTSDPQGASGGQSAPLAQTTSTPTFTPTANLNASQVVGCNLDRQYATPQGNFVIWYASNSPLNFLCRITGSSELTFVQELGNGLEDGYRTYIQTLGYQSPFLPRPFQVYVVSMGVISTSGMALAPGVIMMKNEWRADLRALGAHEFFHAIQWSYQQTCTVPWPNSILRFPANWYINEDLRWWMEASANWVQHEAVPADNSYFAWLDDGFLNVPWRRLDFHEFLNSTPAYGRFIFASYLAERYQTDIIRQIWQQYQQTGGCGNKIPVIDQVLQQRGTNLDQVFPDFVRANYFLAYNEENTIRTGQGGVGQNYRPVGEQRPLDQVNVVVSNSIRLPRDTQGNGVTIDHLGTAYLDFTRVLTQPNQGLFFEVTIYTNGSTPVANVYAITQYASPHIYTSVTETTLLQVSNTQWRLTGRVANFENYEQVTVVVHNPGRTVSADGMTFDYRAVVSRAALYTGRETNGFVSTNSGATWNKYTFSEQCNGASHRRCYQHARACRLHGHIRFETMENDRRRTDLHLCI